MKIKSKISYIYVTEKTGILSDRRKFTKLRVKDEENRLMTQRVISAIKQYGEKVSIDRELVMEILENVSQSIEKSHEIARACGIDVYDEFLKVIGITSEAREPLSSFVWLSILEFVHQDNEELRDETRKAAKTEYYGHCGQLGYTYPLVAEALELERKLKRFNKKYESKANSLLCNGDDCIKQLIDIEKSLLKREA